MIRQKQAFRHKPEDGVWGDCFRTAIACLLELPRDLVPHVFHDGCTGPEADRRMNEWLRARGLVQFVVAFDGGLPLEQLLNSVLWANGGDEVEYLLCGTSKNGCAHVVVCKGGEIAWDPALDDSGIIGPCDSGFWWVTAIAARPLSSDKAAA